MASRLSQFVRSTYSAAPLVATLYLPLCVAHGDGTGDTCGSPWPAVPSVVQERPQARAPSAQSPIRDTHGVDSRVSVVADLIAVFGRERVTTATTELAPYAADTYSAHAGPLPWAVLHVDSTADVSRAVRICAARRAPVIARGAGTSLEGHTTSPYGGVVLDLSGMDAVLAVRPADLDATVQAGVTWDGFNRSILPLGLFFAVDPGPGATLGGMVGTGASGTNALRYGAMKANVLGVTAVLADGSIVKTTGASRARKTAAGYDLTSLLVGSEGTLGIITELHVRLAHVPRASAVATVSFPTVEAACACAAALGAAGIPVAAVELLDAAAVAAVIAAAPSAHSVELLSGSEGAAATPLLLLKFSGGTKASVAADAEAAATVAAASGGGAFRWASDAEGQAMLWSARKEALWAVQALASPNGRVVATTDVCVPLSALPVLMSRVSAKASACGLPVAALGHVGDGNVHHLISFNRNDPVESAAAAALHDALVGAALELGGTCTGEHGIGAGKVQYMEAELGGDFGALQLMRRIKNALDPNGILNPGKKIPGSGNV